MDVDKLRVNNRCFGCGKEGHFHNQCPDANKRKFNIRAFVMEELTPEEREEFLVELVGEETPAEEDFL